MRIILKNKIFLAAVVFAFLVVFKIAWAQQPSLTVSTETATNKTATGATLNGKITKSAAFSGYTINAKFDCTKTTPPTTDCSTTTDNITASIAGTPPGQAYVFTYPVSSLAPNSSYSYKIKVFIINNSTGSLIETKEGNLISFSTLASSTQTIPIVTTLDPVISGGKVVLKGKVNPKGLETTYWFEWGQTTSYGNQTTQYTLPASNTESNVSSPDIPFSGLSGAYNYRLVAQNSLGKKEGVNKTFAIPSSGIQITTEQVTDLTSTSATLKGTITNNNGTAITANFQIGKTNAYEIAYTGAPETIYSGETKTFTRPSGNLEPNTTYHYNVTTTDNFGNKQSGNDIEFKTPATPQDLPTGGTAETIGGWCAAGTGTTSLCAGTERWGTKEDCESASKKTCVEIYRLLAPLPLGENGELTTEIATSGGTKGFADYLKIIFRLAIGVIGVVSVLMIVISGIEYMGSETPFIKGQAKTRLTGAIVGLLIALTSVILLQTIDPTLINLTLGLPQATLQADIPQTAIDGKFCTKTVGGPYNANDQWPPTGVSLASLPNSVKTNHPGKDCAYVGESNCTSIAGLQSDFIDVITSNCPDCKNITITGGTECWLHGGKTQNTNHRPNSPVIDLRFEANLDKYIKSGTKTRKGFYQKDGIFYLPEPDHWHVCKSETSC